MSSWQSVSFSNARGCSLSGLLYRTNPPDHLLVIVCHGFTGSKEGADKAIQMAEFFGQLKMNCLLFDFAGSGQSQGRFEEITLSGQIDDLGSAVTWCCNNGLTNIASLGRSFGGTTALCHAAGDARVRGVCTWAAPASVYKIFRDKSQPDPADSASIILSGSDGSIRLNRDFLDDLATHAVLDQIKKISPRPILILHGTKDETVAPKEAQLLFDAALPPKNIVHIDNGDHSFRNNNREVWQQTADWLKQFVLRL